MPKPPSSRPSKPSTTRSPSSRSQSVGRDGSEPRRAGPEPGHVGTRSGNAIGGAVSSKSGQRNAPRSPFAAGDKSIGPGKREVGGRAPLDDRGPRKTGMTKAGIAIPKLQPSKLQSSVRIAEPGSQVAVARVSRRASDLLRQGHVWVYATEVEQLDLPETAPAATPRLVVVVDNRELLLGTALYSPSSQISLRLVTRQAIGEAEWLELLEARLRASIQRRLRLLHAENDSCRLVFSEADELPGVVIDKYGDLAVLQLLVKGLDCAAARTVCARVLREAFAADMPLAAIWERPDPRIREIEGLAAPGIEPLYAGDRATDREHPPTKTVFRLNGMRFEYDANAGQKTGAFLDQRENYAAAARWAIALGVTGAGSDAPAASIVGMRRPGVGRVLDVCTYQGGFALHLAEFAAKVTGIDASRASLEVAERNLAANRDRLAAEVEWIEADAFAFLRDQAAAGAVYDAIVLDPPAFAKTKRAVEGALRGYKEMNLRALQMLRPGGLLVTCSCSHHVGWAELESAVAQAAADARVRVRILERRGAAQDHPVVLNLPETEYLKCLICQVD